MCRGRYGESEADTGSGELTKAVHTMEKLVGREHKTSKKLSQATAAHDQVMLAEEKAQRDIDIKQHHQAQLEQDVTERKAALERAQHRKATHDVS